MYRLRQILQNSWLRLEGWLYRIFGFCRQIWKQIIQFLGFLAQLLGFTSSQQFLEDETPSLKLNRAEPELSAPAPEATPPTVSNTRRRPDASMEYYRQLAQQTKTTKRGK